MTAARRGENPEPFVVTCGYLPSGEVWVNAKGQPVPVYLHVECWESATQEEAPVTADLAPTPPAPDHPGGPGEQQTMF